jgi:IS30 family transposase
MRYSHLKLEEREWIFHYRELGYSNREIGRLIGRHHTTISREIKRNAPYLTEYIACKAHTRAKNRSIKFRKMAALKKPQIFLYVREKLRLGWSPESISGRLPLDFPGCSIHFETIYRYVYDKRNRKDRLWEYLTLGRKKRRVKVHGRGVRKRGKISGAVSIEKRSKMVEKRKQFGHWETDNMEGPKGTKTTLSASIERKTRYLVLSKMKSQTARAKTDVVIKRLLDYPVRTITTDNGKENSYHEEISASLAAKMYFCHAYASWEKGSVERGIKNVRRYIPKGTNLKLKSKEDIALIEWKINNTPMKCLGWLKPSEKMEQELIKHSRFELHVN